MAKEKESGKLKITQVKSGIGYHHTVKKTLKALGLRKLHQTVEQPNNAAIRGMIFKIEFLVKVEEA